MHPAAADHPRDRIAAPGKARASVTGQPRRRFLDHQAYGPCLDPGLTPAGRRRRFLVPRREILKAELTISIPPRQMYRHNAGVNAAARIHSSLTGRNLRVALVCSPNYCDSTSHSNYVYYGSFYTLLVALFNGWIESARVHLRFINVLLSNKERGQTNLAGL